MEKRVDDEDTWVTKQPRDEEVGTMKSLAAALAGTPLATRFWWGSDWGSKLPRQNTIPHRFQYGRSLFLSRLLEERACYLPSEAKS